MGVAAFTRPAVAPSFGGDAAVDDGVTPGATLSDEAAATFLSDVLPPASVSAGIVAPKGFSKGFSPLVDAALLPAPRDGGGGVREGGPHGVLGTRAQVRTHRFARMSERSPQRLVIVRPDRAPCTGTNSWCSE
jgi:hypothetical protein